MTRPVLHVSVCRWCTRRIETVAGGGIWTDSASDETGCDGGEHEPSRVWTLDITDEMARRRQQVSA